MRDAADQRDGVGQFVDALFAGAAAAMGRPLAVEGCGLAQPLRIRPHLALAHELEVQFRAPAHEIALHGVVVVTALMIVTRNEERTASRARLDDWPEGCERQDGGGKDDSCLDPHGDSYLRHVGRNFTRYGPRCQPMPVKSALAAHGRRTAPSLGKSMSYGQSSGLSSAP